MAPNCCFRFAFARTKSPSGKRALKCICNENFDFFIFALPKNSIFSDHFDTNLVEKFELEVCEFLVQSWAIKILGDEIPARPKGHYDVCSVTQCAFLIAAERASEAANLIYVYGRIYLKPLFTAVH